LTWRLRWIRCDLDGEGLRIGQWNLDNGLRDYQNVPLRWFLFRRQVRQAKYRKSKFIIFKHSRIPRRYVRGCVQSCSDADACNASSRNLAPLIVLVLPILAGLAWSIYTPRRECDQTFFRELADLGYKIHC